MDSLTNSFPNPNYASPEISIAERMITGSSLPFFGVRSFETFFSLSCYQENEIFEWSIDGTCPLSPDNYLFSSIPNKNKVTHIGIYPNPSTGLINIESEFLEINKATVYDLNGKIVYSNNSSINQIDLSHLNKGIYILELESSTQVLQEKIIIE